jgi:hypothetical protein
MLGFVELRPKQPSMARLYRVMAAAGFVSTKVDTYQSGAWR